MFFNKTITPNGSQVERAFLSNGGGNDSVYSSELLSTGGTIAMGYGISPAGNPGHIAVEVLLAHREVVQQVQAMPNNGQLYPLQYDLARQFASSTRTNGQIIPHFNL